MTTEVFTCEQTIPTRTKARSGKWDVDLILSLSPTSDLSRNRKKEDAVFESHPASCVNESAGSWGFVLVPCEVDPKRTENLSLEC